MGQPIEDAALSAVSHVEQSIDELMHPVTKLLTDVFAVERHGQTEDEHPTKSEGGKHSTAPANVTTQDDEPDKNAISRSLIRSQTKFVDALLLFVHDHNIEALIKRQEKWIAAMSEAVEALSPAALAGLQESFIMALANELKKQGVL